MKPNYRQSATKNGGISPVNGKRPNKRQPDGEILIYASEKMHCTVRPADRTPERNAPAKLTIPGTS